MRTERYIELLLEAGALRFGEFKTKSGRLSPYFFNTGQLDTGERLGAVAELYAEAIAEKYGDEVENLFGPAYKGIPLAVATAEHLARRLRRDVSFTFNRKEAKDHGEGGTLIGRSYRGGEKVVVIEDVITGGTSFRETLPMLKALGADVIGLSVGVDRQERGAGPLSALDEVCKEYDVSSVALATMKDVVEYLYNRKILGKIWIDDQNLPKIEAYRAQYGAP